jgi:hypothetical protein
MRLPLNVLCAYECAKSNIRDCPAHTLIKIVRIFRRLDDELIPQKNLFVELSLAQNID